MDNHDSSQISPSITHSLQYEDSWLKIYQISYPIAGVFRISRGAKTHADVVMVEMSALDKNGERQVGRGESVPYARYGESIKQSIADLAQFAERFDSRAEQAYPSQKQIQTGLKPSAARNALDCAWWDLQCKLQQTSIWQLSAKMSEPTVPALAPSALITAYTLSLDTPENMAQMAAKHAHRPLLKLKLAGEGDIERVKAVRENAPQSKIIVDANEGWDKDLYLKMVPELEKLNVSMIEQPFPSDKNHWLDGLARPIKLCADESCHDSQSLGELVGRFDMINIKLDKTGGLTQALILKEKAQALGFDLMVGCMVGSSLAMAPAFVVAQGAQVVDLDGPLLLAQDCAPGFEFEGSLMQVFTPKLWG